MRSWMSLTRTSRMMMNSRMRHWRLMKKRMTGYWNLMTAKTTMTMILTKMTRRRIDYYLRMKSGWMSLRTMIDYYLMTMSEMTRMKSDYWMMMTVMTQNLMRSDCWNLNLKSDYLNLMRKNH